VRTASPHQIEWLTPEQSEFYGSVVGFARSLPDDVAERDAAGTFSRETWEACARFGIQGMPVPERLGGGGMDVVSTMLGLEALGYGHRDNGLVFSINAHMWTSEIPLWTFGTPEQQERWVASLCDGRAIGCHTITEPEAGSDAFGMRATARRVEGGYVLNGRKTFITNAPVADLFIVFARDGEGIGPFGISAFLVEKGTPGLEVGAPTDKLGLRTSPMAEVYVDDCLVSEDALLGSPGQGGEIFTTSMRWERACIMASQVGLMRRTMETCVAYARQRRQFGKPIAKFESVADKVADMKVAVDAARALVLRVGWLMDQGRDAMTEAAVAKAFVAEASVKVHLDAIQIHGGYGYTRDYQVERDLRDAIGGKIYSGTTEIQRRIIARGLGL
jgi:alkylation response protein AidB-like acyl-CoA dehydrogenase